MKKKKSVKSVKRQTKDVESSVFNFLDLVYEFINNDLEDNYDSEEREDLINDLNEIACDFIKRGGFKGIGKGFNCKCENKLWECCDVLNKTLDLKKELNLDFYIDMLLMAKTLSFLLRELKEKKCDYVERYGFVDFNGKHSQFCILN